MRREAHVEGSNHPPMAIVLPAVPLALTPVFDLVRAMSGDLFFSKVAFGFNFVGICLALVAFLPRLVDWLAHDRGTTAGRVRSPSLLLHALALVAFSASAVHRLVARGAPSPFAFAAATAGLMLLVLSALRAGRRHQPIDWPRYAPSPSRR
jgi:uncharacterized membrane protein